jgi:hypothetical protein
MSDRLPIQMKGDTFTTLAQKAMPSNRMKPHYLVAIYKKIQIHVGTLILAEHELTLGRKAISAYQARIEIRLKLLNLLQGKSASLGCVVDAPCHPPVGSHAVEAERTGAEANIRRDKV